MAQSGLTTKGQPTYDYTPPTAAIPDVVYENNSEQLPSWAYYAIAGGVVVVIVVVVIVVIEFCLFLVFKGGRNKAKTSNQERDENNSGRLVEQLE